MSRDIIIDHSEQSYGRTVASEERLKAKLSREIDERVGEMLEGRVVTDLTSKGKVKVKVKLDEPSFHYDHATGNPRYIIAGNDRYRVGDTIEKPPRNGGRGRGNEAGNGPDEAEGFVFEVSSEELEAKILKGLRLPNMEERKLQKVRIEAIMPAGYRSYGPPATLDMVRSSRKAIGRRRALHRPSRRDLDTLLAQIRELELLSEDDTARQALPALREELARVKSRRKSVPWIDPMDMQYHKSDIVTEPVNSAVMFNIMDVSASVTEHMKRLAKNFFWLQRFFLMKEYKHVEMIWIRHTTHAQEVDEKTFFTDPLTGGTNVESAIKLMLEIQKERFPKEHYNIFGCQASDGDAGWNYHDHESDALKSALLIEKQVLPLAQYFAYVECHHPGGSVGRRGTGEREYRLTSLWEAYECIHDPRFVMRRIDSEGDIYPVFRGMFSDDPKERAAAA
jgi:uncharacterized protein